METDTILDVFDQGEPLTTPEVADAIDISQRAAWVYLSSLADDGLIERTTGSDLQMDTWSLPESADDPVEDESPHE